MSYIKYTSIEEINDQVKLETREKKIFLKHEINFIMEDVKTQITKIIKDTSIKNTNNQVKFKAKEKKLFIKSKINHIMDNAKTEIINSVIYTNKCIKKLEVIRRKMIIDL